MYFFICGSLSIHVKGLPDWRGGDAGGTSAGHFVRPSTIAISSSDHPRPRVRNRLLRHRSLCASAWVAGFLPAVSRKPLAVGCWLSLRAAPRPVTGPDYGPRGFRRADSVLDTTGDWVFLSWPGTKFRPPLPASNWKLTTGTWKLAPQARLCPAKYRSSFARKLRRKYRRLRTRLYCQLHRSLYLDLNLNPNLDLNLDLNLNLNLYLFPRLFRQLFAALFGSMFDLMYGRL